MKGLENEGFGVIFGTPGKKKIDVMDAILDSNIKFFTVRHEQGVAPLEARAGLNCPAG